MLKWVEFGVLFPVGLTKLDILAISFSFGEDTLFAKKVVEAELLDASGDDDDCWIAHYALLQHRCFPVRCFVPVDEAGV